MEYEGYRGRDRSPGLGLKSLFKMLAKPLGGLLVIESSGGQSLHRRNGVARIELESASIVG